MIGELARCLAAISSSDGPIWLVSGIGSSPSTASVDASEGVHQCPFHQE